MATKVLAISAALLLSKPNAAKEEREPAIPDFNVVRCSANRTFLFQLNTVDCINAEGERTCELMGLFLANKQRCYKCCSIASNSSKPGAETPSTTEVTSTTGPTLTASTPVGGYITSKIDQKSETNIVHVTLIPISSTFVAIAVIGVAIRYYVRHRNRRQSASLPQEEQNNMVEEEVEMNYVGLPQA